MSNYDDVINRGVTELASKDVLTNKDQSFWLSVKEQNFKAEKIEEEGQFDLLPYAF